MLLYVLANEVQAIKLYLGCTGNDIIMFLLIRQDMVDGKFKCKSNHVDISKCCYIHLNQNTKNNNSTGT